MIEYKRDEFEKRDVKRPSLTLNNLGRVEYTTIKEAYQIVDCVLKDLGYLSIRPKAISFESSSVLGRNIEGRMVYFRKSGNNKILIHRKHKDVGVLLHELAHAVQYHIKNDYKGTDNTHDNLFNKLLLKIEKSFIKRCNDFVE